MILLRMKLQNFGSLRFQIHDTVKSRTGPRIKGLSWKIQDAWSPYWNRSLLWNYETCWLAFSGRPICVVVRRRSLSGVDVVHHVLLLNVVKMKYQTKHSMSLVLHSFI